jgi:hypothetical protein
MGAERLVRLTVRTFPREGLDHRKLESTVRYLGIEMDDALALSEPVEL